MKTDLRRTVSYGGKVGSGPVLYVVARDQRVRDNWALFYALERANQRDVPLLVLFALGPMFQNGSARHNEWMLASLKELSNNLTKKNIPFFLNMGEWSEVVLSFIKKHDVGEVVLDFNPLEPVRGWRESLRNRCGKLITVVDAHNVVPCWLASQKAEFAAYTFRPKIHRLLAEFLVPTPSLPKLKKRYTGNIPAIAWDKVKKFRGCDYSEIIPDSFVPGEAAAMKRLHYFVDNILSTYHIHRNDPTLNSTSGLSAYIRWGNISTTTVALMVKNSKAPGEAKEAFLEELIVRRELAENYCFYTKNYLSVKAAHAWARETIEQHKNDVRDYLYTYEEFREGKTHDALWNAAQTQMVTEGIMHGYLRMYWAKKILEWTPDAQTAINYALKLNDHYELDGRDSNGVVGVMWSICGVHDRAWNERSVFGKIRYMNFAGCKRKFDVKSFIAKYQSEQTLF